MVLGDCGKQPSAAEEQEQGRRSGEHAQPLQHPEEPPAATPAAAAAGGMMLVTTAVAPPLYKDAAGQPQHLQHLQQQAWAPEETAILPCAPGSPLPEGLQQCFGAVEQQQAQQQLPQQAQQQAQQQPQRSGGSDAGCSAGDACALVTTAQAKAGQLCPAEQQPATADSGAAMAAKPDPERELGAAGAEEQYDQEGLAAEEDAAAPNVKLFTASSKKQLTSKFRGVCWNKKNKRWQAAINSSGKYIYLGSYTNEDDAARQFDRAAIKIRGKKAKLNFSYSDYVDEDGNLLDDMPLPNASGSPGGKRGSDTGSGGHATRRSKRISAQQCPDTPDTPAAEPGSPAGRQGSQQDGGPCIIPPMRFGPFGGPGPAPDASGSAWPAPLCSAPMMPAGPVGGPLQGASLQALPPPVWPHAPSGWPQQQQQQQPQQPAWQQPLGPVLSGPLPLRTSTSGAGAPGLFHSHSGPGGHQQLPGQQRPPPPQAAGGPRALSARMASCDLQEALGMARQAAAEHGISDFDAALQRMSSESLAASGRQITRSGPVAPPAQQPALAPLPVPAPVPQQMQQMQLPLAPPAVGSSLAPFGDALQPQASWGDRRFCSSAAGTSGSAPAPADGQPSLSWLPHAEAPAAKRMRASGSFGGHDAHMYGSE